MKYIYALLILLLSNSASPEGYNYQLRLKFWQQLYPQGGWTLYCNERFELGDTRGLNIEHVYPASWMAVYLGCGTRKKCRKISDRFNQMESDIRNLWPSLAQYNQIRSNHPYGDIPGDRWKYSGCDFEFKGNKIEPSERVKGQIARSMIYMREKYRLPINDELMERWDQEYPLTDEERRRNAIIQGLQ